MTQLALMFITAIGISALVTTLMIRVGIADEPNARSGHVMSTPTAGGLGLLAALGVMALISALYAPTYIQHASTGPLLIIALIIALIGLFDDVFEAHTKPKFLILAILSGVAAYIITPVVALPLGGHVITLPVALGWLGSTLWIFVVMNAVNFMDGANGFMALFMAVISAAFAIIALLCEAPSPLFWSTVICAGMLGFLPFNFRRKALIFCGDTGALLVGFMFAIATLLLVQAPSGLGGESGQGLSQSRLYAGPILFMPFLTDVMMTLLYRARRRQNLFNPHRDHLYQRAIDSGWSHPRIALAYGSAGVFVSAIAIGAVMTGWIGFGVVLLGLMGVSIVIYVALQRALKHQLSAVQDAIN